MGNCIIGKVRRIWSLKKRMNGVMKLIQVKLILLKAGFLKKGKF